MNGKDNEDIADIVRMGISEDEMDDGTQQNVEHPECGEVVDGDAIAGNRRGGWGMAFHSAILQIKRLFTKVQWDTKFVESIFIGKVQDGPHFFH